MGKRRGHGEGAIYQRESDGLWCTSVDLGIVSGKRKRKVIYGKTRKEVAEKLKALHRDQMLGVNLSAEQLTTGAFLDRWLQQMVAIRNRPRTHISYSDTVRLYIKPHPGDDAAAQADAGARPGDAQRAQCPGPCAAHRDLYPHGAAQSTESGAALGPRPS
ncbi:MAG: hypothetical protein WCK70_18860 [Chloroflexales bacterium]